MLLIIKPALLFMLHPYICLKATMCTSCTLMSSFWFFYHLLGLWCHVPLHCPRKKIKIKRKQNPYKVRKWKKKKIKLFMSKASHNNLWNDLGFSLCAALYVCHVVTTSNNRKKSKIRVSADWYVTIEHQRSSSIRVIFIDYHTSELQCNY